MAIAYCILAHKNPEQIRRLLRAVWHPENLYVLHYDKRSPRVDHEIVARLPEEFPGVRILPCKAVFWGRFSQVAVQIEALKLVVQSAAAWTHFINLTGQDFPLKSQAEILSILSQAVGTSFINFFDPFDGVHWRYAADRLSKIHIDSPFLERLLAFPAVGRRVRRVLGWSNRIPTVPLLRRKSPEGFRYFGGSNHLILSRDAATYIVHDPNARKTIRRLRWSGHPDESIFQSSLLNSRLSGVTVNDDRRAVFWEKSTDASPQTLTFADFERLRNARSGGKLFARKFDAPKDSDIIDLVEREFLGIADR
jgi:hypothetical protein